MERRRQLLGDKMNHFRGKTDINPLTFNFNGEKSYSVETNENGEFDFTYDFQLDDMVESFMELNATNFEIIELDTTKVTSFMYLFRNCIKLTNVDISCLNTLNVRRFSGMFENCSSLIALDLSSLQSNSVVDMQDMFNGCTNLTSLNFSNLDMRNVDSYLNIFSGCTHLEDVNLSSCIMPHFKPFIKDLPLKKLNLSYGQFDNVINVNQLFESWTQLEYLDITAFQFNLETYSADEMFAYCWSLKYLNLSKVFVDHIDSFYQMFYCCEKLETLEIPDFNIRTTNIERMFTHCDSLTHIKTNSAFRNWCIENADKIDLPLAFRDVNYEGWEIIN